MLNEAPAELHKEGWQMHQMQWKQDQEVPGILALRTTSGMPQLGIF